MKNIVTFLGPLGTTFSCIAYKFFAGLFRAPVVYEENYLFSEKNEDIIDSLIKNKAQWGSIAMGTSTSGRIQICLELFMDLLNKYNSKKKCSFTIIAGLDMDINFCLLSKNTPIEKIEGILAHKQALIACNQVLKNKNLKLIEVNSNGEAARMVAEESEYKNFACIAPSSAAKFYGLNILEENFQKESKKTTFYLLGPKNHEVSFLEENRALIICRPDDRAASLLEVLMYFKDFNLKQIHSMHTESSTDIISLEVQIPKDKIVVFRKKKKEFLSFKTDGKNKIESIIFGPFPFYR